MLHYSSVCNKTKLNFKFYQKKNVKPPQTSSHAAGRKPKFHITILFPQIIKTGNNKNPELSNLNNNNMEKILRQNNEKYF